MRIDIEEHKMFGGEITELVGEVPPLIVEILKYLLKVRNEGNEDPEAVRLLRRINETDES